jgi:hypothetical protein
MRLLGHVCLLLSLLLPLSCRLQSRPISVVRNALEPFQLVKLGGTKDLDAQLIDLAPTDNGLVALVCLTKWPLEATSWSQDLRPLSTQLTAIVWDKTGREMHRATVQEGCYGADRIAATSQGFAITTSRSSCQASKHGGENYKSASIHYFNRTLQQQKWCRDLDFQVAQTMAVHNDGRVAIVGSPDSNAIGRSKDQSYQGLIRVFDSNGELLRSHRFESADDFINFHGLMFADDDVIVALTTRSRSYFLVDNYMHTTHPDEPLVVVRLGRNPAWSATAAATGNIYSMLSMAPDTRSFVAAPFGGSLLRIDSRSGDTIMERPIQHPTNAPKIPWVSMAPRRDGTTLMAKRAHGKHRHEEEYYTQDLEDEEDSGNQQSVAIVQLDSALQQMSRYELETEGKVDDFELVANKNTGVMYFGGSIDGRITIGNSTISTPEVEFEPCPKAQHSFRRHALTLASQPPRDPCEPRQRSSSPHRASGDREIVGVLDAAVVVMEAVPY